jgi:hypothetical protein
MSDDPDHPLPLIQDPTGQTMLIEPYPLNKTFVQKYPFKSKRYSTFKVFAKFPDARHASIHDMSGGGLAYDFPDSGMISYTTLYLQRIEIIFLHYRYERYGKADSPADELEYFPGPEKRFGHLIKPWYPPK